jgi:hypothetical protein
MPAAPLLQHDTEQNSAQQAGQLQLAALCVSPLFQQLQRFHADGVLRISWIVTPRQQHHTCSTPQNSFLSECCCFHRTKERPAHA